MSDYIEFEDLKEGEEYEIEGLFRKGIKTMKAECESKLKNGEVVFRYKDSLGGTDIFRDNEDYKFKLHKPTPLLTDDSIGKWYEDGEGFKVKIYGKIEVEGKLAFVGQLEKWKRRGEFFMEDGKYIDGLDGLIKEVE